MPVSAITLHCCSKGWAELILESPESRLDVWGTAVVGEASGLAEDLLGVEWRNLLLTQVDREREGLAVHPGTRKVKNTKGGEGAGAFHDAGHNRRPSSCQKAGKCATKWLTCVSPCEAKEVDLVESRNEELLSLLTPEVTELNLKPKTFLQLLLLIVLELS